MTDRAATRERLVEMREHLIDDLGAGINGGGLSRLNEVQGCIAAIDCGCADAALACETADPLSSTGERFPPHGAPPQPPARAVVVDDGRSVRLIAYGGPEALATVELDPARALALAGDLIEAARRRL